VHDYNPDPDYVPEPSYARHPATRTHTGECPRVMLCAWT